MRLIFLVLILSTFSYSLQDAMCTVPSGYTRVLDTNFNIIDYTDSRTCNTFTGTKYNCYGTSDKELIYTNLETLPNGLCNYHMIEKQYKYIKDCGADAIENPNTHLCECSIPSMIYDDTSNSCSCPSGQTYNGDTCEVSCSNPSIDYQVSSFTNQSECTKDNLQNLYNQNNNDNRIIESVLWHCDNKCYFIISPFTDPFTEAYYSAPATQLQCTLNGLQAIWDAAHSDGGFIDNFIWYSNNKCYYTVKYPNDNNTTTDTNTSINTDNNTTTGTSTNTDTNTINTNISDDGSILAAINNSNVHLGQVNTNLGTISGRIKVAGDINKQETKYQGDRLHDDILALQNQLDNSQYNLESALARLNETNLRGFAGMGSSTGNENNGSSFDGNITVDLNDSRIVEANNNTTIAINNLTNMGEGEIDSDTSFFDSYQGYYDDIIQSVDNVENNVNDLMATIQGDYTPQFQSYNSCIVTFSFYNRPKSVNMCKFSPILRPYLTFILTIAMLILLIRLHFYLFPKVFKSD